MHSWRESRNGKVAAPNARRKTPPTHALDGEVLLHYRLRDHTTRSNAIGYNARSHIKPSHLTKEAPGMQPAQAFDSRSYGLLPSGEYPCNARFNIPFFKKFPRLVCKTSQLRNNTLYCMQNARMMLASVYSSSTSISHCFVSTFRRGTLTCSQEILSATPRWGYVLIFHLHRPARQVYPQSNEGGAECCVCHCVYSSDPQISVVSLAAQQKHPPFLTGIIPGRRLSVSQRKCTAFGGRFY